MIYKRGSKGDVVKQIQIALHINPDGIFGPLTEQAVKEFQRKNGLVVDGIVGDKTLSLLLPKPQEETFITKGYINTHITRLANRPIKYIAIHYTAGSTSRKGTALNTRNVFTISIEICSNLMKGRNAAYPNHDGWYFTDASLDNARKLVRFLMAKYNIPKSNVVRHYDISGKMCPGIIGWNEAPIYSDAGKQTGEKNNRHKWVEFHNSI